jgi:hypothetical protein
MSDNIFLQPNIKTVEEDELLVEQVLSKNYSILPDDIIESLPYPRPIQNVYLIGDIEIHNNLEIIASSVITSIKSELIKEVKNKLHNTNIVLGSSTIHIVIKYAMEAVECLLIDGMIQKNYAITIINELINELPESNEKQFLLNMSNQGNIDNIIELVIDASKGRININKIVDTVVDNTVVEMSNILIDDSTILNNNNKNNACSLIFACITYFKRYKKMNINDNNEKIQLQRALQKKN